MDCENLELIVHPLCPFAQRTLYTSAFKGINIKITEVAPALQEPWFLELNPLGEVPVLKVTKGDEKYVLTESLNISEYFDSFPGPHLYPRNWDGSVNALEKGIIDVFTKNKISRLFDLFNTFFISDPTKDSVNEAKETVEFFSKHCENGNYMMHKILRRNEITYADVMAFPLVDWLFELKEDLPGEFSGIDLRHIWQWYENIRREPWAVRHKPKSNGYRVVASKIKNKTYEGLELPLSVYENVEVKVENKKPEIVNKNESESESDDCGGLFD